MREAQPKAYPWSPEIDPKVAHNFSIWAFSSGYKSEKRALTELLRKIGDAAAAGKTVDIIVR